MEEETPGANKHVACKCNEKYGIMAVFSTADDAFEGQVNE